ncbi:hypothetical protein SteCoe_23814 [Stentor coeruleus]|uniref:Transcription factor IIIC subunit 5 HTH domain-containing protein n=1 Tax=Stentor coeruleus TaxID=5963 RepID=A0A1R2BJ03_9CILI|nr:hypothetical protein SteCoe_23814 [Stentor coeruleus]
MHAGPNDMGLEEIKNISDFSFDIPEDDDEILKNFHSSYNFKNFLVPASFTKHKLIDVQPFAYNPFSIPKSEEIEIESKAIKSISIPFEETKIPFTPLCKQVTKTMYFDMIKNYFNERPIWLKNVLIQSLPEGHNISKNHLKHLLAFFTYSYESGPWRNTYVRLEYDPKSDPQSLIYQVIDFRTKEDIFNTKGPYDYTFTTLPRQQGQLYQLCDIESDKIKQILLNTESIGPDCTVRYK